MKKQILLIGISCVLLGAASGCQSKQPVPPPAKPTAPGGTHTAVGGTITVDDQGTPSATAIWGDEGSKLTFSTVPGATLTVKFHTQGICTVQGNGQQVVTCTAGNKDGNYKVDIVWTASRFGRKLSEKKAATRATPAAPTTTTTTTTMTIDAYIRSCNGCTT